MIDPSLEKIKSLFDADIIAADSINAVESVRVKFLGRKGLLTNVLRSISSLPLEDRKEFGSKSNEISSYFQKEIEEKMRIIRASLLASSELEDLSLDPSEPAYSRSCGSVHQLSVATEEIAFILSNMGFQRVDGPELETEHYNFSALNTPEYHPARQMQDSFYLESDPQADDFSMLRTHTTASQARFLSDTTFPASSFVLGRVYRRDLDATHSPVFHQVDGLWIDNTVGFREMRWCMESFFRSFFGMDAVFRFRPSYFPFTEPSAEVDVKFSVLDGVLKLDPNGEWLEVAGCGMLHDNVLINAGIKDENLGGFAFGMGVERLAMLKFGVPDLRSFFDSDVRLRKIRGISPFLTNCINC